MPPTLEQPRTSPGQQQTSLAPQVRRRLHGTSLDARMTMITCLASSLAITWLAFHFVFFTAGLVGFVAFWYLTLIAMTVAITAVNHPRPIVVDRLATTLVGGAASILALVLASAIGFVLVRGAGALRPSFLTHDMSGVGPTAPLSKGGILHAVVGSLIELGIAVALTVPLGVVTAVYLSEVGGRLALVVRAIIEAMTALPSIVAGLFIYTVLIVDMHYQRDGLAAALALSVMGLPIMTRATDVVLRVVPGGLREAGFALGASRWQTVWRVVLPTARPGMATALILAVARMVGETSPVLLTSGASTFFNADPFNNPMNSLPLFIFFSVRSGQPNAIARGFGAAFVLMVVVLVLFVAARLVARRGAAR